MTPEQIAAIRTYNEHHKRKDVTALLAHIDTLTAAVERVEKAYDGINGWHDVTYENVTEALYALLALTREHR